MPKSDQYRYATQQTMGIHQLELEQAPRLRVLFKQSEEDVHVTLTAEQAEELRVEIPGAPSMLGAMHSRAEISCSCKARRVEFTIFYLPWKDDVLIHNETSYSLFLKSVPNELDVFKIPPRQYAVVYLGFWQLRDDETTVEFLLRPRRYRLLVKDEANKRSADQPLPSSKRSKHSTEFAMAGAVEAPSVQDQKTIIRPTVVDVDILNRIGLGENQSLNMIDGATGQHEYSLKRIDRYLKRGDYADVFKAIWDNGSSQPAVVAVKLHKITATEPSEIAAAMKRWKRELQAHESLAHVGCQCRD